MANGNDKAGSRLRKSKTCEERFIKVNEIHYMYRLKDDYSGAGRPIPWIQMKGHWLKQAGFDINTLIKVRVMGGCLMLTTDEEST